MAGIGIKANVALNSKKLYEDIKAIQSLIAKQEGLFKLSVDSGSISQLTELKTQLKEIVALAGKGISIKIDTTVVQKAKKDADALKEALGKKGVTEGANGNFDESLASSEKATIESFQKVDNVVKGVIGTVNELGQAYTETWNKNKKSGEMELGKISDKQDFGKVRKDIDNISNAFNDANASYEKTIGAWGTKPIDTAITDSIAEVKAQFTELGAKDSNLVNAEDVKRMNDLVTATKALMGIKKEDQALAQDVQKAQIAAEKAFATVKTNATSGKFVSEEDINRIKQMTNELALLKTPADLKQGIIDLNGEIAKVSVKSKEAATGVAAIGNQSHGLKKLSDAMAQIGLYFSAWRITSEIFQELKRGIGIVAELDNQIVQVGIDMNISANESRQLITQAQRIASETGVAIDSVIRVAGVYSNANETMESVMAKVKPSAILSGISGASASSVTDMFQGIIAQYKIAGDDIEGISYDISDSVIAVSKNLSKNFDDSVQDISDSLLEAGSVMEMMGYTYKETMALVGATIEVTRQSGSEMGGALKMIGARIGGAKNTGEDVPVEEISNAAKAYHKLGIEIIDVNGNFKPMKDTLAELSLQWDTLSDVEKSNVAEMSAGNRRRNTFIAMMETMEKSTSLTSIALNAQGETLSTNEKYMESSGAKMQNFTNSVDALWQNSLNSETLKSVVDFGTGIVRIADAIGGLNIVIGGLISAFIIHNNTLLVGAIAHKLFGVSLGGTAKGLFIVTTTANTTSIALNKAAISAGALKIAMGLGLTIAIGLVIAGLAKLIDHIFVTEAEIEELSNKLSADGKEATDTADSLRTLATEQNKLESALKSGVLTTDEATSAKTRLTEIYKELAGVAPELVNSYSKEGDALATNSKQALLYADTLDQIAKGKAQDWLIANGIGEDYIALENEKISASKMDLAYMQKLSAEGQKTVTRGNGKFNTNMRSEDYGKEFKETINVAEEIKRLTEQARVDNDKMLEVKAKLLESGKSEAEVEKLLSYLFYSNVQSAEELAKELEDATIASGALARDAKELDKAFDSSIDKIKKYGNLIEEINDKDTKGVSSDSANWILDNAPSLLQFLGDEKKLKEELLRLQDEEKARGKELFIEKMSHLSMATLAQFDELNAKTKNDKEFYRVTVLNNQGLINKFRDMYGIDLKNYDSLAAAKNAVDIKFAISAVANYNALYDEIYRKYNNTMRAMTGNEDYDNMTAEEHRRANQKAYIKNQQASGYIGAISYTPTAYNGVSSYGGTSASGGSGSSGSSASSSPAQKYESEISDGYNKQIALVEAYQNKLDLLDRSITRTTENIARLTEQGSHGALVEALKEENKLYAQQQEKIRLLGKAQAETRANQDVIARWMNRKYGVNMTNATEEGLDYYLDKLFPKLVSTNEALVNQRNAERDAFEQLYSDYMMLGTESLSFNEELIASEAELMNIIRERYEIQFQLNDLWLAGYRKTVDDAMKIAALFNDATTYDERESNMASTIGSLDIYRKKVEGIISDLQHQLSLVRSGSAEWVIVNDQINAYQDTLQSTNTEILGMQQNLKALRVEEYNASMSVIDKLVSTLRIQYEEAKKAELDALKATLDAEVGLKTAEIKVLQDRLDALNDDTADKQAELRGLKEERAMWEEDDTIFAKAKLAELDALIKEKEEALEKDKIQAEIDAIELEVDDKQEAYDEEVTSVEEHYTDLLAEQALYAEASRMFQTMSQDEILDILLSYDEKYKGMGSVLGAAFAVGLLEEITKGMDGFDALTNGLFGEAMIPWLESLGSSYNYGKYQDKEDYSGKTSSGTSTELIRQRMSVLGDTDKMATSGLSSSLGALRGSLTTTIGTATISMPVNFFTNGQYDVDKSILDLEGMFKNMMVGSGVMLSLNK